MNGLEGCLTASLLPACLHCAAEVFLPLFFASSGIRTDIGTLGTARYWGITLAIVLVATVAKFTPGCLMTKLVARQNWHFSVAMGLLMNTRGLVEIIALNVGLSMVSASRDVALLLLVESGGLSPRQPGHPHGAGMESVNSSQ
jgi:Kef-type K+ transport system membrane component KefB